MNHVWLVFLVIGGNVVTAYEALNFGGLYKNKYSTTFNPWSTNATKWSNTLKPQFANCLSVFNHYVVWRLKG